MTSTAAAGDIDGVVTFRIAGAPPAGVSVAVTSPSPARATATINLGSNVLPRGAGTYPVTAVFVPAADSPYEGSESSGAEVVVRAEGQRADGTSDGTTSISFTGPSIVERGKPLPLTADVRQSQGAGATDREFVRFDKVRVKAVFVLYRCSTTCATTPSYTSPATAVASGPNWPGTGNGHVTHTGPTTLAAGSYKLTVRIPGARYLRATQTSSTIRITDGPSVGWETNSGSGTEPSIAVNPFDPRLVATTYQYNFAEGCDYSGVRISRDGGRTWRTTTRNPWSGWCADHHGQVAWGPGSTPGTYRLWVANAIASGGIHAGVTHSDDLGASWSTPYIERRTAPWVGGYPDVTVDTVPASPNFGAVYVTYNWLESKYGPGLAVIASGDVGRTWQITQVPVVPLSGYAYHWRIGYRIRTAPSGAVYVSFYQSNLKYWSQNDIMNQGGSSNIGRLGYATAKLDYDRAARRLVAAPPIWAISLSRTRISLPYAPQWQSGLEVDAKGRVWLAVSDYSTKGYVHVGRSTNGGRSWTWTKIGASGVSLFKTSLAVRNDLVFVGFHSMDSSSRVGTMYTMSYDAGATYRTPRTVTSAEWAYGSISDVNGVGLRENASFGSDDIVRYAYGDGRLGNAAVSVYVAGIIP